KGGGGGGERDPPRDFPLARPSPPAENGAAPKPPNLKGPPWMLSRRPRSPSPGCARPAGRRWRSRGPSPAAGGSTVWSWRKTAGAWRGGGGGGRGAGRGPAARAAARPGPGAEAEGRGEPGGTTAEGGRPPRRPPPRERSTAGQGRRRGQRPGRKVPGVRGGRRRDRGKSTSGSGGSLVHAAAGAATGGERAI